MSWMNRLFGRGKPQGAASASVEYSTIDTASDLDIALRGGSMTASGAPVTAEAAMRVAAVFRCVDIRASALACLPVHVMQEGPADSVGRKVGGHPMARLLGARPNRRHNSFEFRRLLGAHVLMRGNGYALKVRSGRRLLELLPMHPDRMRVEEMPDLTLRYHYTRPNGSVSVFPQEDVFHLRDLSTDGITGLSRITQMREAVGVALQAERFGARLFSNGIGAGGALKHPGKLTDPAAARLKAQIEERYAGADSAHKWMVLEEGMAVERLGLTSEDMQFLETRKFQRSDIAMFYGVPPHLLGDVEKTSSWGTGIEQQNLGFLQYTLGADLAMWEQAIERDLLPDAGGEPGSIYVKFNVAGFLRAASKDRAEYFSRALGAGGAGSAWMTPNEVRALDELPPLPGGDALPKPPAAGAKPPPAAADPDQDNPLEGNPPA